MLKLNVPFLDFTSAYSACFLVLCSMHTEERPWCINGTLTLFPSVTVSCTLLFYTCIYALKT